MNKPAAIATVLVIDDHPIVIQGLRCWLKDAHVKAVLEARDVTSGYRLFRRHHPDVVIIDLPIRGSLLGGLDVIRRMRAHDPRSCILVFSMHRDPAIAIRALKAGATGYMLKDAPPDEVIKALHQLRSGNRYLSDDLAMQVALSATGVDPKPLSTLRPRESQMLSLLAKGQAYSSIAKELNVSYKTVVNTCSQLRRKLNATNLAELIHAAVRLFPAESQEWPQSDRPFIDATETAQKRNLTRQN
jgi:two-component system, NarL family, invasion response regulator UvrY